MTPANPDALADALATCLNDSFRGVTFCGGRWSEAACNIAVADLLSGPLAPILTALQRLTAERDAEYHRANKAIIREATTAARAAQLQAAVEALREALKPHQQPPFSTALAARAATAREGQTEDTELERLKKENKELQTQLDALVQEVIGG